MNKIFAVLLVVLTAVSIACSPPTGLGLPAKRHTPRPTPRPIPTATRSPVAPTPTPVATTSPTPKPSAMPTPIAVSCIKITSPLAGTTFHLADPSFTVSFTLDNTTPSTSCGSQFSFAMFKVDAGPLTMEVLGNTVLFSPQKLGLGTHTFSIQAENASAQIIGTSSVTIAVIP